MVQEVRLLNESSDGCRIMPRAVLARGGATAARVPVARRACAVELLRAPCQLRSPSSILDLAYHSRGRRRLEDESGLLLMLATDTKCFYMKRPMQ